MEYILKSEKLPWESCLEHILKNRGIKEEDIYHFLHTTNEDTYDSKLLDNMAEGAAILAKHLKEQNKIFIQVDSDCDGYTSSALLINYLNNLFPYTVQNNISYRVHEGKHHGLLVDTIPEGTKLVILPDSSSNDYAEHQACAEAGIDVLILDHHEAEKVSEYACVINNQLCDYPTKSLSGVGIVYKFCKYIDELMETNYADNHLDLVALGMIADMMDTRDFETQYLIQQGLRDVRNPLFIELSDYDERHFGAGDYFMTDVAWYIAPYINAMTREGTQEEKMLAFESMLEFKAYQQVPSTKRGQKGKITNLVCEGGLACQHAKKRQNDSADSSALIAEEIIIDNNLLDNKVIIIKLEKGQIAKDMNGLMANKLSKKYQRPVLVLQKTDRDGVEKYEGSARGCDNPELKDFRQFLLDSGLVEYAQGHAQAFGVGILEENINKLQEYCNKNLPMIDGSIKYEVDFIWNEDDIQPSDILDIAECKELWGQYMDEPIIVLENIKLTDENVRFLGKNKNTLRIDLPELSLIKFLITDEEKEKLTIDKKVLKANIVGKCDKNEFMGKISPQIKIDDFEVFNDNIWYF